MYNEHQQRFIARELARSGGNIPGALDALHRNYESFRTLCEATIRKLLKQEGFQYHLTEQQNNLAFAKGDTELQLAKAHELAVALRDNPLRQLATAAANEAHELAKSNPGPRTYEVLFAYLKLLRSLEPKIDAVSALEDKKCH